MMNLKVIRVTSPMGLSYIEKHLLPDEGDPGGEYLKGELRRRLIEDPNNIFILVAAGDQDIEAFLIAVAPDPGRFSHVFIFQAWVSQRAGEEKIAEKLFYRTTVWAQSMGKDSILMETLRDPNAFTRRWGFKPRSTTMEFRLDEGFETRIADRLTMIGETNGRKEQQAVDNLDAQQGTGTDLKPDLTPDLAATGDQARSKGAGSHAEATADRSVSGSAAGSLDPGSQSSEEIDWTIPSGPVPKQPA